MEDTPHDAPWADAPAAAGTLPPEATPPLAMAPEAPAAGNPDASPDAGKPVPDPLHELADLDFLLEDIEDRIAPLALSAAYDF